MRGMTFIDVVVGTAIMLTVFLSIFAAYQLAVELVMNSKARVGGLSLVSERMEYLKSLPYESLGTVGGIPSGTIAQVSTTTKNNISYTMRTLIKYIDDPADGVGGADTNSITADSKELKVEVSWTLRGRTRTTFAVTRVAPHGIESLTSGGTLRVNVFDALAQPVQGASVRITNASSSPTIDVTVSTDVTGSVAFPGAPQASNYEITISKTNYSSAQTYDITGSNPNPNPAHVSVANQQTTTASFAIDAVASLLVKTISPIDVGLSQGSLLIEAEATTTSITPAELVSWDTLDWTVPAPVEGTLVVQLMYLDGSDWVLIPDGDLSGNSAGLAEGSTALSGVSTTTYPTLALRGLFTPTDASSTPPTIDWEVNYHAGPSPLPNIGYSFYGTKTIGTSISGAPIYKVVQNLTTNASGESQVNALEWDTYTFGLTGTSHDIAELCPSPVAVAPGTSQTLTMTLLPKTSNSLRVEVTAANAPLAGATVTLTSPGNRTADSSACGQAFFSGLSVSTYTLTISKSGYQTNVQDVSVTGATVVSVPLVP